MNKIVLSLFLISGLFAAENINQKEIKENILNTASLLDKKFNIDKKIILAYIKTESGFNLYPIAMKTNNPAIVYSLYKDLGYETKRHGKYVSVIPKNFEEAEFAYELMAQNKEILSVVDYDLGVMQINTRNIARYGIDEKETYLNYKENMLYGADIIRGCYETLKNKTNISNILECYNRGSDIKHLNNSDRSYLSKFLKNYKSL